MIESRYVRGSAVADLAEEYEALTGRLVTEKLARLLAACERRHGARTIDRLRQLHAEGGSQDLLSRLKVAPIVDSTEGLNSTDDLTRCIDCGSPATKLHRLPAIGDPEIDADAAGKWIAECDIDHLTLWLGGRA